MPRNENQLVLVPYDPDWPSAFEAEANRLLTPLGSIALRIDHNGSTSVPGLAAKPIIDIQISVAALQPIAPYEDKLASLGYIHVPHADDAFCPFFHKPLKWPHTHHVHLVETGGVEERRTLAFRDYLRDHPIEAVEYERLKQQLIKEFPTITRASREAYTRGKSDFIERVIAIAFEQGYPKSK
jgi:GrpB-like predicted nucleotidyltransferase (UPF0157 family)